ncbi:MAG TPA: hypothetical protein VLA72_02910, partial [Anaerolineales bacterium]|nr:hypothetical protein [Anaerolineales bacterium]
SDSYQTFLLHLLSQVSGKVILIQDGARYHTSKATHEFFEQHKERLIVGSQRIGNLQGSGMPGLWREYGLCCQKDIELLNNKL